MKKWMPRVFAVYIIFCLFFSALVFLEKKELIHTERYGLETDGTVRLTEDAPVRVRFRLEQEGFTGLNVKFQSEQAFADERIRAALYDCGTGELLAETVSELQYEIIRNKDYGSTIYFSLPAEGAPGREAEAVFLLEGEKIRTEPELVVSRSASCPSELYVGGHKEEGSLVFTARYSLGERYDYSALAEGFFCIAAGCSLFWLLCSGRLLELRQEGAKPVDAAAGCPRRLYGGAGLLFISLLVVFVYVYQYSVEPELEDAAFLGKMYLILCIALAFFALMLYYYCFVRQARLEKVFLMCGILMGTVISSVVGVYTVPDEPSHIDSAYQLSNELLGIPESPKPGYLYKRKADVDSTAEQKRTLDTASYERLYRQLFTKAEDESLTECAASNNFTNAGRFYYLPQAVGMSIGRLLGWGTMPMLMAGRLLSLLCSMLIMYLAVRNMPFAKLSLLLIGLLPITLQQAASFSYDAVLNAVAFLFVSSTLAFAYAPQGAKGSRAVVIAVTGSMLVTVKGGVYLPMAFLPLLILLRQKKKTARKAAAVLPMVLVPLLAFLTKNLTDTLSMLTAVQGSAVGGSGNKEVYTFGYLLRYPHRFIGMFVNTFYRQGDSYIRNLLGGNLGWREVDINWTVVIGFLLVLLLSCMKNEKECQVSKKERLCMGALAFASFFLIELSMLLTWTSVKLDYITGVQGRYFLPFFILILLVLRNSFFRVRRNIDRELLFAAGVLDVATVLQAVQFVLK